MQLTVSKSILIGSLMIALAIIFRVDENVSVFTDAKAEVAGMDAWDLKHDWDFKKAVKDIIEDCEVYDDEIDC